MVQDRERLGETVTEWIAANPKVEIVDTVVSQSSDDQFHCITISVFFYAPPNVQLIDTVAAARASRPDLRRRVP